jgi:hypothetical protein
VNFVYTPSARTVLANSLDRTPNPDLWNIYTPPLSVTDAFFLDGDNDDRRFRFRVLSDCFEKIGTTESIFTHCQTQEAQNANAKQTDSLSIVALMALNTLCRDKIQ